jgi:hypothetical protein
VAAVGTILALLGGAAALTPGAQAAGQTHKCANQVETIELPGPSGPTTVKTTVKDISTQGVTCAAAYKFLILTYKSTSAVAPEHYKCKTGHFKAPTGYVPEVCTRPGARIQYAAHGG